VEPGRFPRPPADPRDAVQELLNIAAAVLAVTR
jgi:hypothetical protein